MQKRVFVVAVLLAFLLLLSCTACQSTDADRTATNTQDEFSGIYRFEDYENDEVFDIEKVRLSDNLALQCTTYKFSYLSDDYRIKAYISIPNEFAASQEPGKCILYNRGGNRDYGKLEDNTTAAICAVCNRIVIASQYRGADGSQGYDEFGGADLHDVIKLIDLCENHFSFVDMDDFVVMGASRGGMMTYMTAREDSRVKRIVAISAVSDLFDMYERREDMQDVLIETVGFTPQQEPEEYEKRSAIYWYDEIKVPVLIFHCTQDAQVAFSQAQALYEKLKDVTDCTFITHDDDMHGLLEEDYPTLAEWLNRE